ncbi:MAG: hypothetical protein ACJAYG_001980 [Oceanicoccus sp.]|jgi:hypothetical protein
MDVSAAVDVSDPQAVSKAVLAILDARYPAADFSLLTNIYEDFAALYRGELAGFLACDTSYHDIQHVLDVSLAMARLLDGYDRSKPAEQQLGAELALVGMIVALFHDSGYIRRQGETDISHGAEYTKIHVTRSAQFMAEYLPTIGCDSLVELCGKLVHFTGYEFPPDKIELDNPKQRLVGCMAGTADVIAQMADPAYLQKCRDRLYPEFLLGGMTRRQLDDGGEEIIYQDARDLLLKTPAFIKTTIEVRLEGHFGGLYHYVAAHFGGDNLYMQSLQRNFDHLEQLIARQDPTLLDSDALLPEH